MYRFRNKKGKQPIIKSPFFLGGAVLLVAIGIVTVLELTNTTHLFHKRKAISSTIPSSSNADKTVASNSTSTPTQTDATSSPATDTSADTAKSSAPTTSTTNSITAPYGNFVSNHTPGKGNGAPTQESSVCLTTPGATCTITFTNADNVVKTLEGKVADANGAAYWDWDISSAGFTDGTWNITATASLNGKSTSTKADQPLVVKL